MPNSKKRKVKPQVEDERELRAINPTKSKFGRLIILILAIGMFAGMLVAAVIGMVNAMN